MGKIGALSAIRGLLRRFGSDCGGVSAVEFAIILPFMLALYLGGAELGDGMSIQYKATLAARTVADLTTRSDCQNGSVSCVDSASMGQILGAASVVMTPYAAANMTVTVSELETNGGNSATVQWSCASNGTARVVGSTFSPTTSDLQQLLQKLPKPSYLILGEVTYPYTPSLGYAVTGTIDIYQSALFFPRILASVTNNNAC